MTPKHIAIIMDGNGRWAKERGFLERSKGHEKGAEAVRNITTHCAKIGIGYLTLYAFSTENWKRPKSEIDFLMKMLDKFLTNELKTLQKNNIRFITIGDLSKFSIALQNRIKTTADQTAKNSGLTQVLALNYGSQDEIARAVQKVADKKLSFTAENISQNLDTAGFDDLDMLIRTGGEKRLSNYLLWQAAYSELFFTDTLFPDFSPDELDKMIAEFATRDRRFGGI